MNPQPFVVKLMLWPQAPVAALFEAFVILPLLVKCEQRFTQHESGADRKTEQIKNFPCRIVHGCRLKQMGVVVNQAAYR